MIRIWAPMFRIGMGIPRAELEDMSVPEMVEHIEYWQEVNRGGE